MSSTYRLVRDAVERRVDRAARPEGQGASCRGCAPASTSSRASAWRADSDSPIVGRDDELALLARGVRRASSPSGPAALVTVRRHRRASGKSRLIERVRRALRPDEQPSLRGRCLSYGEGITFWPIESVFRGGRADRRETSPERRAQKIRAARGGRAGRRSRSSTAWPTPSAVGESAPGSEAHPGRSAGSSRTLAARPAARGRLRRHRLGRATLPRPASKRVAAESRAAPDPAALHGTAGPARAPPGVGRATLSTQAGLLAGTAQLTTTRSSWSRTCSERPSFGPDRRTPQHRDGRRQSALVERWWRC